MQPRSRRSCPLPLYALRPRRALIRRALIRRALIGRMLIRRAALVATATLLAYVPFAAPVHAEDVSAPATLQMFESTWKTMEYRAPDIFAAGYGAMWTPPPGRADTSNQSVGYDL